MIIVYTAGASMNGINFERYMIMILVL